MTEEVKAEIIENDLSVLDSVNVEIIQNAIIRANESIARGNEKVREYGELDLSVQEQSALREMRADINDSIKGIDRQRKMLKQEFERPYNIVKAALDSATEDMKALEGRFKSQIDANDKAVKQARENHMREHYSAFAGDLAMLIPYEKVADPKWLNAAGWKEKDGELSNAKNEKALEDRLLKIKGDYDALCETELFDPIAAKNLFFARFDLAEAIQADKEARAQHERLEEIERRRAERMAQPEPEPKPYVYEPDLDDAPYADESYAPEPVKTTQDYIVKVTCTRDQLQAIADFARPMGIRMAIVKER